MMPSCDKILFED